MKKAGLAIWMLILAMILPSGVLADDFKLTPSVGVKEEYTDNLFFNSSNEVDDTITTLFGGLDLSNRTERLDLNLNAKVDGLMYAENDDLNDVEQFYKGRISYRITERVRLGANGGYQEDSRPGRDIETTGFVFTGVKRKRWTGGASGDFTLSETSAATLSYAYQKDKFDKPEYVDYEYHTASLGYTHDFSKVLPRVIGRINAGYAYYNTDDTDIEIYSATLGFSRAITEIFDFLADAGVRYASSEFKVPGFVPYPPFFITATDTEYDWGPTGRIVLGYNGEVTRADISASKEIQPASGSNGTVRPDLVCFQRAPSICRKIFSQPVCQLLSEQGGRRKTGQSGYR